MMLNDRERINQLLKKLESLQNQQEKFQAEFETLRIELNNLRSSVASTHISNIKSKEPSPDLKKEIQSQKQEDIPVTYVGSKPAGNTEEVSEASVKKEKPVRLHADWEKFIGENLINKIGIAITVIGVSIGVKYAIDHDLISPVTRIIAGYAVGLVLLGFGVRLRKNYQPFSAVLLGGAMACMYFITYAAYSFYDLYPQTLTFVIMVLFTVVTVGAALSYNMQVIAHIGLVGAYAIPFLLSEDPSRILVLFSYVAIINAGILFIAFRKFWKPLYYSSFIITWGIYLLWFLDLSDTNTKFNVGMTFNIIYFIIFYLVFLSYKMVRKETFRGDDVALLLLNSFIFFGIGYSFINNHPAGEDYLGLFTLSNAIVHALVALLMYRDKLSDRNLFLLVIGLVLIYLTSAIPIQLDGSWVTLIWAGEAVLLFWIGRTRKVSFYEALSYAVIILAFISILIDWTDMYDQYSSSENKLAFTPFLNIGFLTSILVSGSFGYINLFHYQYEYPTYMKRDDGLRIFISLFFGAFFLITLFFAFRTEIAVCFTDLHNQTGNDDLSLIKNISLIDYALIFSIVLSLISMKYLRDNSFGMVNIFIDAYFILLFLTKGLYVLSELRSSYLHGETSVFASTSQFIFRYLSIILVSILLFIIYRYINQPYLRTRMRTVFDYFLFGVIMWILSSELIHWLDLGGSTESNKLGLSILWGSYALFLIIFGIWQKKRYLRIGAIGIFAVTMIKLFFYDLTELNTISKTIVFIILGSLLLITSFLYNKYKYFLVADSINDSGVH